MAKNCLACGKNIGLLTVRIPLLDNQDLVICSDCFEKMPPIINELYQERIYPTKTELLMIREEVIRELKEINFNQDTINVVTKFLDEKIARAKDPESREEGRLLKKCPICKNPFYEYDYVVVPNMSDGSTNKEYIKEILASHAMQGWRLVTMYSNEIGKNAITVGGIGGNVTICEDVLVFERCIKGVEN